MKIRNGFVSNSSSSSFIIPTWDIEGEEDEFLNTTSKVARYMISCREDPGWENGKLIKKLDKAIKDGRIKEDDAICFHTCNYDTYIIKKSERIYIDTCNNHKFEELEGIYDVRDEGFYMGDLMEGKRFYFLEYDIFVTQIPFEMEHFHKTKTCFGERYKADDGNIYCIRCETEKFKEKK